jgi:hypothetical protein
LLNIPPVGRSTATGLALDHFAARMTDVSNGRRPDTELVAILLTDGNTLEPYDEFLPAVQRFRETGVRAYAFGIGSEINSEELALIASSPAENHVYLIDNFNILQLQEFVQNAVLGVMCSPSGPTTAAPTTRAQTTVRPSTRPATTHRPDTTRDHETHAPETTQAPTHSPLTCNRRTLDLVLVIDNSAAVAGGWSTVIQFVQDLLGDAIIGRDATRVATIVYSSTPSLLFSFTSSFRAHDVIHNLDAIPTSPATQSDVVAALNYVADNLFAPTAYGYRGGAGAVLVVTGPQHQPGSILDVEHAAGNLQDLGVTVHAVTVGAPSTNLAEALASEPYASNAANVETPDHLSAIKRVFSQGIFCFGDDSESGSGSGSGSGEGPIATATPTPTLSFTTPEAHTTQPAITTVHVEETTNPADPTTTVKHAATRCVDGVDNNGEACACSDSFCSACDFTAYGQQCTRCTSNMILYSHRCVGQCPSGYFKVVAGDGSLSCEALCMFSGVDVALVIDSSSSISAQQYTAMLQFAVDLIATLPIGSGPDHARVGLVNFAAETDIELLFSESVLAVSQLQDVVRQTTYHGGLTATNKGLLTAKRLFHPSAGYRGGAGAIVLFTDGESCGEAKEAADALKQAGIEIYTVGFGSEVYHDKLKALASSPASTHVFFPADPNAPEGSSNPVIALAQQVACSDAPHPAPVTSVTCTGGKLSNGDTCSCGPACSSCTITSLNERKCLATPDCTYAAADVVFVLDVSDQLGEHQFPFALRLLENIVAHLPVGASDAHVGLISYADSPNVGFGLKQAFSSYEIGNLIAYTPFVGGGADLTSALEFTRTRFLWSSVHGFRSGPLRVVIVGEGPIDEHTVAAAAQLKAEGAELFAIGVGTGNVSSLPMLLSSADHLFLANDLDLMTEPTFAGLIARSLNCPEGDSPTGSPVETWPPATESPSGSGDFVEETRAPPSTTTSNINDRPALDGGSGGASSNAGSASSSGSSTYVAVIAAVAGVALVAAVGYFVVKHKNKAQSASITATPIAPVIPPRLTKKKLSDVNFDLSWDNEFSGANAASLAAPISAQDTAAGSIVRRNVAGILPEEPQSTFS